jgi:probable HAF family extracellular repeat protein
MGRIYISVLTALGFVMAPGAQYLRGQMYKITELVPEDIESRALAINNSGQVVGIAAQHAFFWDPTTGIQWLPTLAGFNGGSARGINGAGHVVGCSLLCQGQACMAGRAFFYRDGSLTDLQAGEYSCATAINDAEQVTGYSHTSGFFWSNGTLTNIIGLGDFFEIEPRAINQAGDVVGARWETVPSPECYTSPYPPCHFVTTGYPFRWTNGSLVMPGAPLDATASAINNSGVIAGTFSRDGRSGAFLTNSFGIIIELGVLNGNNASSTLGINNADDVVGTSYSCEGGLCSNWTAFLYQNGVMVDLNDRVSQSDWRLLSATAINDKGQILAIGRKDGKSLSKALLLTPAEMLSIR